MVSSFSAADRLGPSPAFPAASGGLQPGPNAFLRQRAFILSQRSKDTQQECPLRDGGIHLFGQGEQGGMLEVRSLPMVSLETRMYPTSMSEKLLFACFRLSKQSGMFFELILPGCDRSVKAPWHSVGKPRVLDRALQLPGFSAKNLPVHARERAQKSLPEAGLRAGEGG